VWKLKTTVTNIVEVVARVAAECEERAFAETHCVHKQCLHSRHDKSSGSETDEVLVDEGEAGGTIGDDVASGEAHSKQECAEGVDLVLFAVAIAHERAFDVVSRKNRPGCHAECVPAKVKECGLRIPERLPPVYRRDRVDQVCLNNGQGWWTPVGLVAAKVEGIGHGWHTQDHCELENGSVRGREIFGVKLTAPGGPRNS